VRAVLALLLLLMAVAAMASDRYLALGDSYTIGEGVPEQGRWPVQLAERMGWATPTIIARTGWSTDELAAAIDRAELTPPYAQVSLLIGVNNQYRGRTVANYRAEFDRLLERALALAGDERGRVFVVSIPDWGVTAFAARDGRGRARIGAEIDAFNAAAREICARRGVRYIDITPTSRERGGSTEMLAADGLHPSAAMYARWTDAIVAALTSKAPR
jgi:lysophospholipase L1-like esterase